MPGETPTSGHGIFGQEGDSLASIAATAMDWAETVFKTRRYRLVIVEAPIPPQALGGLTNWNTSQSLITLPWLILGCAYRQGLFGLEMVPVSSARKTMLGKNSLKSDQAKRAVRDECQRRGWVPAQGKISLDQTDALAIWNHGCNLIDPLHALKARGLRVKA